MSVLVTGAKGFVGQNLLTYLDKEFKTEAISVRFVPGQVFEITSDSVIHLGGKAHDLKKVSQPSDYYEANFEITKQLYDSFLRSDAKKFIFISSVKAAADSVNKILTETDICDPQTHYGKSKLMAEQYIQSKPLPEGKSYYILRPCMIHGPGNKGNLNLLYQLVKRGIPYPLAGFVNKRSFLSIENLCFVIKELISRNNIASGIYQIADDEALSTRDVVSILSESLKRKPRLWYIRPGFIKAFAKFGDKLSLPLTTERLNKLTENFVVSNDKITAAINKPFPLSARAGLRITAVSFQKHQ